MLAAVVVAVVGVVAWSETAWYVGLTPLCTAVCGLHVVLTIYLVWAIRSVKNHS